MSNYTIKGMDELLVQLKELKDINLEKIGLAGGYELLKEASLLCPVKTGYLKNSGMVEGVKDKGAEVSWGAEYAFYVEEGSSKWSGHPFVRPAIDAHSGDIVEKMRDELNKQIERLIK
jgi:HK97 gp10 family phage protein